MKRANGNKTANMKFIIKFVKISNPKSNWNDTIHFKDCHMVIGLTDFSMVIAVPNLSVAFIHVQPKSSHVGRLPNLVALVLSQNPEICAV